MGRGARFVDRTWSACSRPLRCDGEGRGASCGDRLCGLIQVPRVEEIVPDPIDGDAVQPKCVGDLVGAGAPDRGDGAAPADQQRSDEQGGLVD